MRGSATGYWLLISGYCLLVALFLTGCGGETAVPTRVPLASTPVLPALTSSPEPSSLIDRRTLAETPAHVGTGAAMSAEQVTQPPTPQGIGVRPAQARQQFVPDLGLEVAVDEEWRPPPAEAPLSLHPDDHYWLIRPIPSGSRNFDLEWYPYGNDVLLPQLPPYRIHHGVDFPNDTGTPVLAAGSGTVVHAGPLRSPRNGVNYYGHTVIIHHDWQWQGKDVYTLYAHTLELFVQEGDYVEQGQLIAGVGSSGEVSGPHLHFEVRVGANSYGSTRNPALWLVPYEGWGTLAGRFVDKNGRMITGARVTVRPDRVELPAGVELPLRQQMTYVVPIGANEVWRENFVVSDLPAGEHTLLVEINGITYRRDVTIYPGRTTFEIISTNFEFIPTPTPLPTPTLTTTVSVTLTTATVP